MKHARKMVLIPEEEYKELLAIKQNKNGEIKLKVNKVLKGKRDHVAAKKLSQLVGQYLRHKQQQQPIKKKKVDLLQYFAPTYHQKVKTLMSTLEDYGTSLTNRNELVLASGHIVRNSNIVDLLKEALVGTKRKERGRIPVGWGEFIKEIADANVPLGLFTKRSTLDDIGAKEWENF